jgi:putative redox protein
MHDEKVSPFNRSVQSEHVEGFQVRIRTAEHIVDVDEPRGIGDGLAPNPFDMLLSSLCSCTIITIWDLAARGKIPLEKMWADASIVRVGSGKDATFDVVLKLRVRGELSEQDVERIKKYAERCPVHGILSKGMNIVSEVTVV